MKTNKFGYFYAIFSAILFGASTPAAKILLAQINPWLLAGILYLGSGIGIFSLLALQSLCIPNLLHETSLKKHDLEWLAAATVSGGMIAPVLLMLALVSAEAASTSLLLTLEGVFTAIIAWVIFKEHTDIKLIFGVLLIVGGSFVLGFDSQSSVRNFKSTLLVAGACLAWAIDNNFTRNISAADPLQIVAMKSTVAGLTNIMLALVIGTALPSHFSIVAISAVVGFIGYGFSLILFILALRYIGTARTGAYFSIAPFVGACCSVLFLDELLTWRLMVAGLFMGAGVWLHIKESHIHEHQHEALTHDHKHVHDEHHQHEHSCDDSFENSHSHSHEHTPMLHSHFHYPDIHHRHQH